MEKELPKRKRNRLKNYNYSSCGAYFITICTENRRKILSRIVGNTDKTVERSAASFVGGDVLGAPKIVELLPRGSVAEKYINQLNQYYENINVDSYVIMPNHIHILLSVRTSGAPRTSHPTRQDSTVSLFVSTFKRFCNKEIGENIWQISFYDHIIRNQKDYDKHIKYIHENPARWYFDELYSE